MGTCSMAEKRTHFACDYCHQRKKKCLVEGNGCKNCHHISRRCTFNLVESRQTGNEAKRRHKGYKQKIHVWARKSTFEQSEPTNGTSLASVNPGDSSGCVSLANGSLDEKAGERGTEGSEEVKRFLFMSTCSISHLRFHILGLMQLADRSSHGLIIKTLTVYQQSEIILADYNAVLSSQRAQELVSSYESIVKMLDSLALQPPELIDTISILLESIRAMALTFFPSK